ncbi:MAG: hypothetical protein HC883_00030 [Bdellovibrionaceae bacterium]|nr:hypothetical protein [Pseudobdellovibrionaceae bacterium]
MKPDLSSLLLSDFEEELSRFELPDEAPAGEVVELGNLSFWVTKEHKEKYEAIQVLSKRRFGKLLKKVLMDSIDKVYAKRSAA